MNIFLRKTIFFLLPILLLGVFAEIKVRNVRSILGEKSHEIEQYRFEIETLILGTSHEYEGISPQYMKTSAYNLACGDQSLLYDKALLEQYQAKLNNLKFVIIGLDYPSLYWGYRDDRAFFYYHNYGINLRNKNFWKEDMSHLLYVYSPKNAFKLITEKTNKENVIAFKGWETAITQQPQVLTDAAGLERVQFFRENYITESIKSREHFMVCKKLEEMIMFCKRKKITPILVTTPCDETFTKHLEQRIVQKDAAFISKLIKKYQLIHLNYLTDKRFQKTDYIDIDHLNQFGAKKLSVSIDSVIQKLKNKKNSF
ncbi:hypothetical protein [Flavobacterium branchiophilum]|uniref:SGNH/GDSL hydrolase family protein n=1 Tax=Flavobacterium branchiophilum TaxID=55197 RepID=A0A2H3KQG4_9FLAO|nr:hypothetical protein [Flavobacterium branchiophilum]PDS26647.1 hypothetical protein B0A77_01785 [Flavobacterium branchiophilum]